MVIFSDIHYLDNKHKEITGRKLTNLSIPLIKKLIEEINNKIKPDICISLGDLIEDTNNYYQDIKNIKFILSELKNIKVPFFTVLGNHDLRSMKKRKDIEKILGYDNATFSIDVQDYHFVFLSPSIQINISDNNGGIKKTQNISNEEILWLKHDLEKNKLPTLIFCHYGLAEDDMKNNWWFESNPQDALLSNRNEVKNILNDKNIIAVFSGHQHWTKELNEKGIKYYICGSLTENINNNGIVDGVYLDIQLIKDKIKVSKKHIKISE